MSRGPESENELSVLQRGNAHVLMIPYPTQPHILPMLDFAHQLVKYGGTSITITFVSFQVLIDRLKSPSDAIHLVGVTNDLPGFKPPSDMMGSDPMNFVYRQSALLQHNLEPLVERFLLDRKYSSLQGPTCMVADFVHFWSIDVAAKLSIPGYVLAINPACTVLLAASYREEGYLAMDDGSGIVQLPGLPPLSFNALQEGASIIARTQIQMKNVEKSDGILLNTCFELESKAIEALRTKLPQIPVLPVGPLGLSPASPSKSVSMEGLQLSDGALVTNWLDQHPQSSVLYVCFGTSGMRKQAKRHVQELARGLEASQQRFLWVLRAPPDVLDINEVLPPGFEERVKGRGLLLRGWAPQLQILAHPSTGAFLSSCGWNSAVESLAHGVPIIGWPSFADQEIICPYMVADVQVAMALLQDRDYFVEAKEIEKVVGVMLQSQQGRDLREKAGKYKPVLAGEPSAQSVEQFVKLILQLGSSASQDRVY